MALSYALRRTAGRRLSCFLLSYRPMADHELAFRAMMPPQVTAAS